MCQRAVESGEAPSRFCTAKSVSSARGREFMGRFKARDVKAL